MAGELTCPNCGTANPAGTDFCVNCDQYLQEGQPPPRSPAEVLRARQRARAEPPAERPTEAMPSQPPLPPDTAQPPSARDDGLAPIPLPPNLRRCPVCGTANELTRTFCRTCGNRLIDDGPAVAPVAPEPPKPVAIDPRLIGAAAVLGAGLLVALALVWLFGRGGPEIAGPGASPTGSPGGTATLGPGQTPAPTAGVTGAPTGQPTDAATNPPVGGGVTCEGTSTSAPAAGRWRVLDARGRMTLDGQSLPGITRLLVTLHRVGSSDATATATTEVITPAEATSRFGGAAPAGSDAVLVVTFSQEVTKTRPMQTLRPVHPVTGVTVPAGRNPVIVVGLTGSGCYGLSWQDGGDPNELLVDFER